MRLRLFSAAALALLAAACDRPSNMEVHTTRVSEKARLQPVSSLSCPDREGDLRLASRDAQGRSCFYRGENGAEVELRLVALGGDTADAVLDRLQQDLAPLVPAAAAAEPPAAPEPPDVPETPVMSDAGEQTHVRLPGVIDIRSRGEEASIRLPGVTIEASDGKANIRVDDEDGEQVLVDAHDGGAVVQAKSTRRGDVRSTYMVASETPGPTGVRLAGYSARGPAAGPLVVGVARAKTDRHRDVFDDMEDLVRRASRENRR